MVYSDLKPGNLVLVRYINKDLDEETLYKVCYKVKFIDLGSFTFIRDNEEMGLKKHNLYPAIYTANYTKNNFINNKYLIVDWN
jgi:hypothetical protein